MAKTPDKWTVVQHSGYGYAGKPGFAKGLEVRVVHTKAEQDKVEKAGGLLFDTYIAADKFGDEAMFPPEVGGMYPQAAGTFASLEVDGLRVYVPVREVTVLG